MSRKSSLKRFLGVLSVTAAVVVSGGAIALIANAAAPTAGLVGYWLFNEGSGTTVQDSSGNSNTGTLVNGPIWVTGRYGPGLNFDGVNDYVDVGSGYSFDNLKQQTKTMWLKFNALKTNEAFFGRGDNNFAGDTFIRTDTLNPDEIRVSSVQSGTDTEYTTSNANLVVGQWYFLAVTYDDSAVPRHRIYINAIE